MLPYTPHKEPFGVSINPLFKENLPMTGWW